MFIDKDTDIDGKPQPTERTDIVGIVTQYDPSFPYLSGYRLMPRSSMDVLPGAGIDIAAGRGDDVLARIHPNPSRGTVRVVFAREVIDLAKHIAILDVTGREVLRIGLPAGSRYFDWNATDSGGAKLPSGVYFAVVRAGARRATAKVVVLN
jgi:hypothetical protein